MIEIFKNAEPLNNSISYIKAKVQTPGLKWKFLFCVLYLIGGYMVGQKSHPIRSKELSIGKNFLCLPSTVGKRLGEFQKALRKSK